MNNLKKNIVLLAAASLLTACFPVPIPIFPSADDDDVFFPIVIPVPVPRKNDGGGATDTDEPKCLSLDCEKNPDDANDDYRRGLYEEKK